MGAEITYFDCDASVGVEYAGVYRQCLTVHELVAEMDWHGVDQALVYHTLMRNQSPVIGNAVLAQEIAGQPRLVGTWAILPPQTGELTPAPEFFHAMAEANVRALWAWPTDHRYMLDRVTFGGFLDEVAERRIPLFIPGDWDLAYRVLAQYPRLTLVVTAHGPWGNDRYFRPLMEQYPSFHIDISRYELDCGLRDLVSKYGAGRLLYGSAFPQAPMGGPRLMVAQAEIDEASRRDIAGGNLRRLLREVELV
jgi:uncharacterized protein